MEWIALKRPDRSAVEIVRLRDVRGFSCLESGEGLMAQSKSNESLRWEIAKPPPHSPARILLDALNGPVGEVPYK